MALDRLRQTYGVSGGPTTESKIIEIRHETKITFTVNSLKQCNKELNTVEIFFARITSLRKCLVSCCWMLLIICLVVAKTALS